MIRVDVRTDKATPGSRVSGTATWNSEGGKQARAIEVVLRRRFTGKNTKEHIVNDVSEDDLGSRSQVVLPFDFEVPSDAPPTYEGKLVSIIWEIVATADIPWAVDQHDTKVITVTSPVWTLEQYREYCAGAEDDEDEEDDDVSEPSSGTDPEAR
jgi:hypothetical protein